MKFHENQILDLVSPVNFEGNFEIFLLGNNERYMEK